MAVITKSRAATAFIIGFLISGLGHMIIGRVRRGVAILLGAIALGFVGSFVFGYWAVAFLSLPYAVWQLYDLYRILKKMPGLA